MNTPIVDPSLGASTAKATNVQVAVRCRPLNSDEKKTGQPTVVTCHPESKTINASYGPPGKKITKSFTYDKVFGIYSTQEEVFSTIVRPIVDEALAGFNCTIFAYGQTGTGKTHTMEGDIHSEEHAGIVPRSVKYILEQLENSEAEYTIRVSFLELYNEELQDLLNSSKEKKLKLCEDGIKGVVCQNLEEITVLGVSDIFEILQRGIQNRQTAETLCNKNSSRSHSIFTLKIMIKECNVDGEEVVRHGQLNLVDLAGSECVGRSGAKNDRAREAGNINQSLLTLGRVITALVDHHSHVPYRDSKLTRILQESLGGKAKTCIIATLSPSQSAVEETLSTLDYAYRAKSIKNQPTVNQRMTKKVVLKEYCAEIETLRAQLQMTREKNGVYVDPDQFYGMEARLASQEAQIQECEGALKQRNDEIKTIRFERDELAQELDGIRVELTQTMENLQVTEKSLQDTKTELSRTQTELQASEAVVNELMKTEMILKQQGKGLQEDVLGRRNDINKLISKVDILTAAETMRITAAHDYVSGVLEKKTEVMVTIDKVVEQNVVRSGELCEGVSEMITRGKDTCSSLKTSIDRALETLIHGATMTKDEMIETCHTLEEELTSTDTHIVNTLKSLEVQVDDWMREFQQYFQSIDTELVKQQSELSSLSINLKDQLKQQSQSSASYLQSQKDISSHMIDQIQSFTQEIITIVSQASKESKDLSIQAQSDMEMKANRMKDQVVALLHDFVSSGSTSIQQLLQHSDSFASNITSVVQSHSNMTMTEVQSQISMSDVFVTSSMSDLSKTMSLHQNDIVSIQSTEESIAKAITQVSSLSSQHSKDMNQRTVTLLDKVNTSIHTAKGHVQTTASKASEVLTKVSHAATTMNQEAGLAMTEFSGYLNQQGQELSQSLSTHLTMVGDAMSNTIKPEVETMGMMAGEYQQDVDQSMTTHSGNTPKKTMFAPLTSLASSRDVELIRNEVRTFLGTSMESMVVNNSTGMGTGHDEPMISVDTIYTAVSEAEVSSGSNVVSTNERNSTSSQSSLSSTASNSSEGSKKRKGSVMNSTSTSSSNSNEEENNSSSSSMSENMNPNQKIPRASYHRGDKSKSSMIEPESRSTRSRATSNT